MKDVIHKATIELDEAGTTAAAATAATIAIAGSIDMGQTVQVTADHPFLYFICDTQADTIAFMGQVSRIHDSWIPYPAAPRHRVQSP